MLGTRTEKQDQKTYLKRSGIYVKAFERIFSPMTLGQLTLDLPDGNTLVYGNEPQGRTAFIKVNHWDFFKRCILFGDIGFGESYMAGEWDTPDITAVISWMILNVENHPTLVDKTKKRVPVNFLKIFNRICHALRENTVDKAKDNISRHYDLGNDFFAQFLDPTMTYSAAYFKNKDADLKEAQNQKYEELCRKLQISASDHVLEIGSGWGGFALHAAKNYGCRVTTVTISQEQFSSVKEKIIKEGLQEKIEIKFSDYRYLEGVYDKIVSIEMIEAVGDKYMEEYFQKINGLLKKDGLVGLQMILSPCHRYDHFRTTPDWIQKHIFPGSLLPSLSRIQKAINRTGDLVMHDFEDITPYYVKTLQMWRENFTRNLSGIRRMGFDETFIRKWYYYWCYCEAAFDMRNISVAQAVYTRPNNLNLQKKI